MVERIHKTCMPALHSAAYRGNLEEVKRFIHDGAGIDEKDYNGNVIFLHFWRLDDLVCTILTHVWSTFYSACHIDYMHPHINYVHGVRLWMLMYAISEKLFPGWTPLICVYLVHVLMRVHM